MQDATKKNDVRHLLAHRLNDFDIFITGDGEILKKQRLLKERFGITVMAPNELLQKLEM
ncbi:MAG: hypothetical protein AABY96_12155 [Nitrospirota bacterium]